VSNALGQVESNQTYGGNLKVCIDCGSSNIEVLVWINPNTEEVTDWETGIRESVYCNDCGSHNEWLEET
jgi:hypothetical protein